METAPDPALWEWIAVAVLGALVGVAELVGRYRAAPLAALRNIPAALYVSVNAVASLMALFVLTRWLPPELSAGTDIPGRAANVLIAGLSAMAFLRSSLLTLRANDVDVPVGPSFVLQAISGAADRAVDRLLAVRRSVYIARVMDGLDFDKARLGLAPHCFALMQNVGPAEQHAIAKALQSLRNDDVDDTIKVQTLGLVLMNIVGRDVLDKAVTNLKAGLSPDATEPDESDRDAHAGREAVARAAIVRRLLEGLDFQTVSRTVVVYCLAIAEDVDPEQQQALARLIASLDARDMDDWVRVQVLGLSVIRVVGRDVLETVVAALRDRHPPEPPDLPDPTSEHRRTS
ncbi:hypothetical protein [Roseospira visakhapatnamensis]|uniref:Uncharacterized protein n=1 Tax=Roseospira visakhapatnamensis TaxID=390880 RepID=A0A7W6RED1_9PROT|nr:hypothetical protein [Roseospira visakhapatnamensis]MBB4266933.1 hypothetical protein [Roseospira visakhapatnamensis]